MLRPCPPVGILHVRGVAGQQDPSVAVGRGLPRHVGKPGDPGGTVDPVVGPVHSDERLAEIAQGGFAGGSEVLFGHHDPHRPPILQPAQAMDAEGVAAYAPFRLLGQLDLGDQVADGRIPPGNSMPAALRIRLRPPSHPTRYSARSDGPSDSSTSTPVSSCANPVTSRPR